MAGINQSLGGAMGAKLIDVSAADFDATPPSNVHDYPRFFRVTVAGNVKIDIVGAPTGWQTITIPAAVNTRYHYTGISKVYQTGTTATGIILEL